MSNSPEELGYTKPEQEELFGEAVAPTGDRILFSTKRKELERELQMRKRVYPRWVSDGKLTQAKADAQMAILEACIVDYQVRPWPQTRKFVGEWREQADSVTFMGIRISQMHREELLALVAYSKTALEAIADSIDNDK